MSGKSYICNSKNQTEVYRKYLSFFFSLLFLASVIAPSILYMYDDSEEIVYLLDISEEENKERETLKDAEVKFLEIIKVTPSELFSNNGKENHYYSKLYSNSYSNITSPPPDLS